MNQKGFTLTEILGVLVLLTVIVVVAFPAILNAIGKADESIQDGTYKLLEANAKSYANDHESSFDPSSGTNFCVSVKKLVDEDYTEYPIASNSKEESENIYKNWSVTFKYENGTYKDFQTVEHGC